MTWFRIDDGFHSHPKVGRLFDGERGGEAVAMWTLAGSWCAHELTDGLVPAGQLKRFGLDPSVANELVRVGLWEEDPGGYRFHDYLVFNPSRAQVLASRKDGALRKQASRAGLHRDKRAGLNDGHSVTPAVTPAVTAVETPAARHIVTPPFASGPPDPDPDPDPDPRSRIPRESDARDPQTHTHGQTGAPPPELSERPLVQELRAGFIARYTKESGGPPNERALGPVVASVADWIRVAAPLRKLSETALCKQLITAFFASPKAAEQRFAPGWFAQDPGEWLDPRKPAGRNGKRPGPHAVTEPADRTKYYASDEPPPDWLTRPVTEKTR